MTLNLPAPPAFVARLGRRLPAPLLSAHTVLALELARRCRWLQPPAELNGRTFALQVSDLGLCARFSCRDGQFRPWWGDDADLQLQASLGDFLNLARGDTDADTLFFQRRLKIAGDTELGLLVKNWLDASDRPRWLHHLPTIA